MPHVSRVKLNEKLQEKLLNNFFLILSKVNKTDKMQQFLLALLSPTEQIMLAKRLGMFFLIKEGILTHRYQECFI